MDDSNHIRNVRDMWHLGECSHEELQAQCSPPGRWPQALPYILPCAVLWYDAAYGCHIKRPPKL